MSTAQVYFTPFASKHPPERSARGPHQRRRLPARRSRAAAAACVTRRGWSSCSTIHREGRAAHRADRQRAEVARCRRCRRADRHPAARQAARAVVERAPCSACSACWARRRPGTSAASIRSRPACCRSAWARPPRSPATSCRGRKRYAFTIALGERTATGDVEGAVVETLPGAALDAATLDARAARASSAAAAGAADVFRASSATVSRCTSWRARAWKSSARRARSRSSSCGCAGSTPATRSSSRRCAPRAPTSACWRRTSPRALGTCGHVAQLRRLYVEPFEDEPMETLESRGRVLSAGEPPPHARRRTAALPHLPAVRLERGRDRARACTARPCRRAEPRSRPGGCGSTTRHGRFLGIGEADGCGRCSRGGCSSHRPEFAPACGRGVRG